MGNTEGSRVGLNNNFTHITIQLSQEEMGIIIGCILGDGYIYPKGKICIDHGPAQYEYVLWLHQKLQRLCYPKISQVFRLDKRFQTQTISYRFFLRQWFRPLREKFYSDRIKRIPDNIGKWITPLSLAVWYMDDGYLDKKKYPLLMTESYTKEDVIRLTEILKTKFVIDSFLTTRNRIRIASKSRKHFFDLIRQYMIDSMYYKLP
jgi:hypothetical protein